MSSRTNCFGVDLSGLADQILTVMKGLVESNIATLQEYISIYTCLRPVLSFISGIIGLLGFGSDNDNGWIVFMEWNWGQLLCIGWSILVVIRNSYLTRLSSSTTDFTDELLLYHYKSNLKQRDNLE